eukprot:TRINITY_DN15716_c0_g1_i2.p1 TRINITY_DN15716_c0_g1~~TRINITY_DN15716_c0_g1_i2.p1  ORF type:complete len:1031 (+),score=352.95 TRINITY_DN15716_c0_g1_i2:100-3093(+)
MKSEDTGGTVQEERGPDVTPPAGGRGRSMDSVSGDAPAFLSPVAPIFSFMGQKASYDRSAPALAPQVHALEELVKNMDDEIAELQRANSSLQQDLADRDHQISNVNNQRRGAEALYGKAQQEIERLKQSLGIASNDKILDLEEQLQEMEATIPPLHDTISKQQEQIEHLTEHSNVLNKHVTDLTDTVAELTKELASQKENEASHLRSTKEQEDAKHRTLDDANDKLLRSLKTAEADTAALRHTVTLKNAESEELLARLKAKEDELASLKADLQDASSQLHAANMKTRDADDTTSRLTAKNAEAQDELHRAVKKYKAAEDANEDLQKKLKDAVLDLEVASKKLKMSEEETERLEKKLKEAAEENDELRAAAKKKARAAEDEAEKLQEQLAELQKQLKEQSQQQSLSQTEAVPLAEVPEDTSNLQTINVMQETMNTIYAENEGLKQQLKDLQEKLAAQGSDTTELERLLKENTDLQKQMTTLQAIPQESSGVEAKALQEELDRCKAEMKEKDGEIERLAGEHAVTRNEINEKQERMADLESRVTALEEELRKCKNNVERLTDENAVLENEAASRRAVPPVPRTPESAPVSEHHQSDTAQPDLAPQLAKLEKENTGLLTLLSQARAKEERLLNAKAALEEDLSKARADFHNRLGDGSSNAKVLAAEVRRLSKENEALAKELSALEEQLAASTAEEIKKLQRDIEALKAEHEANLANLGRPGIVVVKAKSDSNDTKDKQYSLVPGSRVVRDDEHWKWGDQDGGPGGRGTVRAVDHTLGWACVAWDLTGTKDNYRWNATENLWDIKEVEKGSEERVMELEGNEYMALLKRVDDAEQRAVDAEQLLEENGRHVGDVQAALPELEKQLASAQAVAHRANTREASLERLLDARCAELRAASELAASMEEKLHESEIREETLSRRLDGSLAELRRAQQQYRQHASRQHSSVPHTPPQRLQREPPPSESPTARRISPQRRSNRNISPPRTRSPRSALSPPLPKHPWA